MTRKWKATAALCAAGVLSIGVSPRPTGSATTVVYGDANGDGQVTVADANVALRMALGLDSPTPDQMQRVDVAPYPGVNGRVIGDGVVNVADALRILRFALGLIPESEFRPASGGDVSFSRDVQPILQATCESFLCHGGRLPKGGMDLVRGKEFSIIVGVESREAAGILRVKPGDPDQSYLLAKLMNTQDSLGGGGARMPAGEGLIPRPLPDDQIKKIHDWIAEGAPDN